MHRSTMHRSSIHPTIAFAAWLVAFVSPATAWGQAPTSIEEDPAWIRAADLERAGRHEDAARALQPLAAEYPSEYAVALQLAWYWFEAGEWSAARRAYAHALALSNRTSALARLGLAWSLLRMGRAERARRQFERVIEQEPGNNAAREGLSSARAAEPHAVRAWVSLLGSAEAYVNHRRLHSAFGVGTSVGLVLGERFLVGATYRYLTYDASAQFPRLASNTGALHQAHFTLGYVAPTFALRAHGYAIADADSTIFPAYGGGVSLWAAARGSLAFEAGATHFADTWAGRIHGTWDIALVHGFTFGPVASLQYFGSGGVGGSLGARLGFQSTRFAAQLSGHFGDERRVVYLNDALAYGTDDHVRGGLTASARVHIGSGISITGGYEWQRLGVQTPVSNVDADSHTFTVGLLGAW